MSVAGSPAPTVSIAEDYPSSVRSKGRHFQCLATVFDFVV